MAVKRQVILDWLAAVEPYSPEELQAACRAHVLANRSQRPNEGHIHALLQKVRYVSTPQLPRPKEPDHVPMSRERAAEVMAELGIKLNGWSA